MMLFLMKLCCESSLSLPGFKRPSNAAEAQPETSTVRDQARLRDRERGQHAEAGRDHAGAGHHRGAGHQHGLGLRGRGRGRRRRVPHHIERQEHRVHPGHRGGGSRVSIFTCPRARNSSPDVLFHNGPVAFISTQ